MTIQKAREVLADASSKKPEKIRGGLRTKIRAAATFVRHSGRRTFNDMELVTLVEGMLGKKAKRWPHPHEMHGAVLFRDTAHDAHEMSQVVVELIDRDRKFDMKHEIAGFKLKLVKKRGK